MRSWTSVMPSTSKASSTVWLRVHSDSRSGPKSGANLRAVASRFKMSSARCLDTNKGWDVEMRVLMGVQIGRPLQTLPNNPRDRIVLRA